LTKSEAQHCLSATRRSSKARSPGAPSPAGFVTLDWSPQTKAGKAFRAGKGGTRAIWKGYDQSANLRIEAVALAQNQSHQSADLRDEVLNALAASPPNEPIDWSVFQTSFRVPARFDVVSRRLHPGHMAMLFRASGGERLVLRQAYPRQAALARRDLAGWLRSEPFGMQKRRFYPAGPAAAWSVESSGQRLEGLIRRGPRRLPAPLGWVAPRWSVQAIVEDARLDRLLLAECDSRREIGDEVVSQCIGQMNRTTLQAGAGVVG
jgi:hypothetical protein